MWFYRFIPLLMILFSSNAFAQQEPQLDWQFGMLGHDLGQAGLLTVDIDNDGKNEIITSGRYGDDPWNSYDFFSILFYDSDQGHYVTQFISNIIFARIITMQVYDLDKNGISELYLGLDDGTIAVYNLKTLKKYRTISTTQEKSSTSFDTPYAILGIEFSDGTNDQAQNLVAVNSDTTYLYDAQYKLIMKIPYGARHIRIGNIDNDEENEIIYSDGTIIQIKDSEVVNKYAFTTANSNTQIELANMDDDGILDVVYSSRDTIHVFNFNLNQLVWSSSWQSDYHYDRYITGLWLFDYDGDQIKDVFIGDKDWDAIYCYNGKSGQKDFNLRDGNGDGVENLAIANLDNDSSEEIIWTVGASCTCADYLFVYDLNSKSKEWQSKHFFKDFKAFDVGDVDNDGQLEIVAGTFGEYDKYYDHGFISVFDAKSKSLEWQNNEEIFNAHVDDFTSVKIGDVNNDGLNELLLGIDYGYSSSKVYVFDDSNSIIKQYEIDGMDIILDIEIADIDIDGNNEVIVTSGTNVAGSTHPDEWQNYLYIFDGETADVEWKSPQLDGIHSKIGSVKVANIDQDEALEVVALQYGSSRWEAQLLIYDGITQELTAHFMSINALDVVDFDKDGTDDVLVGLNTGNIGLLEQGTFELINTYDVGSGKINALKATDFNHDGKLEFVLSDDYKLYIYDPSLLALKWQSDTLNLGIGNYNSLLVEDLDGDNNMDILLNVGHAINNYEVVDYEALNTVSDINVKHILMKEPIFYPNPFQDKLFIKPSLSSDHLSYEIRLFNLQGKELYSVQGTFQPMENFIDISSENLQSGTYIYQLHTSDKKTYSGLILKNN